MPFGSAFAPIHTQPFPYAMPDVLREWVLTVLSSLPFQSTSHASFIAVRVQGQVIRLRILSSDLLLPDPQASRSVGHHGQRVGIQARRLEHPGRLRHSGRSGAASPAVTVTPPRAPRPARSGVAPPCCASAIAVERDVQSDTGRQKLSSFHSHGITASTVLRFRRNVLLGLEADLIPQASALLAETVAVRHDDRVDPPA